MSAVPIFHARISADGRVELAEQERQQRQEYLRTLAGREGREVEIIIRKVRTQRSGQQDRYLHGVVYPILQKALGYESLEELKLALMGEKWGYQRDPISGRDLPIMPHTSQMTVEQCTEFIEWLPVWAMHFNEIHIPLPNEAEAA